jgi:hypothetical protein
MLESILSQQQLLTKTQEAFQQAVVKRNAEKSCDFLKTIQIVGTVVSVAAGAYQNSELVQISGSDSAKILVKQEDSTEPNMKG